MPFSTRPGVPFPCPDHGPGCCRACRGVARRRPSCPAPGRRPLAADAVRPIAWARSSAANAVSPCRRCVRSAARHCKVVGSAVNAGRRSLGARTALRSPRARLMPTTRRRNRCRRGGRRRCSSRTWSASPRLPRHAIPKRYATCSRRISSGPGPSSSATTGRSRSSSATLCSRSGAFRRLAKTMPSGRCGPGSISWRRHGCSARSLASTLCRCASALPRGRSR